MSTTKQYILTDGEKFYTEAKGLGVLGDGLKSYANKQAAAAAARMIKKFTLTPVSLSDAKNGKATEMQADSEEAIEEGAELAAKETSEEVLAAKEAREYKEMLASSYGHITPDPAKQKELHLFTLSPAYKKIGFSLEWLKQRIAEYEAFIVDIPTPQVKADLLTEIKTYQAKMEKYRGLFADDPDTLDDLLTGLKAKISPLRIKLEGLPDENKVAYDYLVGLQIAKKVYSAKYILPSTSRGKNGNSRSWTMGEGQFLAFDYSSTRVCQNGLDLSKFGLASIQAFVYHPDHENVKDLSIPAGKLAIVTHDHILVATIDAKQALGNILGEAVFEIVKPNIDRAKFVQAISSTGVDAFQSKKSTILSKTAKTVSAAVIKNGQHLELEQAGNRPDTEKDHAPVVE